MQRSTSPQSSNNSVPEGVKIRTDTPQAKERQTVDIPVRGYSARDRERAKIHAQQNEILRTAEVERKEQQQADRGTFRIGDRDPDRGKYETRLRDGRLRGSGAWLPNASRPKGSTVEGVENGRSFALNHRSAPKKKRRRRREEVPPPIQVGEVKILYRYEGAWWLGGDRATPIQVSTTAFSDIQLAALGSGENDWLVSGWYTEGGEYKIANFGNVTQVVTNLGYQAPKALGGGYWEQRKGVPAINTYFSRSDNTSFRFSSLDSLVIPILISQGNKSSEGVETQVKSIGQRSTFPPFRQSGGVSNSGTSSETLTYNATILNSDVTLSSEYSNSSNYSGQGVSDGRGGGYFDSSFGSQESGQRPPIIGRVGINGFLYLENSVNGESSRTYRSSSGFYSGSGTQTQTTTAKLVIANKTIILWASSITGKSATGTQDTIITEDTSEHPYFASLGSQERQVLYGQLANDLRFTSMIGAQFFTADLDGVVFGKAGDLSFTTYDFDSESESPTGVISAPYFAIPEGASIHSIKYYPQNAQ